MSEAESKKPSEGTPEATSLSRRDFLRRGAAAAAGVAALAAAMAPLRELDEYTNIDEFLQKHYKELTPDEMDAVLKRVATEVEREYEVRPHLRNIKPTDGVQFAMALNLSRCIGCRRCVHACVAENNQSVSPEMQYIRVVKMPHGTMDLEQGDHDYDVDTVPEEGHFYMPVQCHQCANPPCVKVCPVQATWAEPDGIVVIDYNWCIGCRYCAAACPYWARRFNYAEPNVPKDRLNPEMAYLSNRPRQMGVMEKCTYCLQRSRTGKYPACLEACPTGSRLFGNVLDPESSVAYILQNKRVFILKEDLGTVPRFYYYFEA